VLMIQNVNEYLRIAAAVVAELQLIRNLSVGQMKLVSLDVLTTMDLYVMLYALLTQLSALIIDAQ